MAEVEVKRAGGKERRRDGEPEVVGAAEGDEVTPPVHKHVTRLPHVDACTGRERKGALQLVKRLYLLECFLP